MRNYGAMRNVLAFISWVEYEPEFNRFEGVDQRDRVIEELQRLRADGLIESTLDIRGGLCFGGKVSGLTAEGREFWRLIENDKVWALILQTLDAARIDVPYPLLKEVCEEIVRRYVTSFIPGNI